MTRKRSPVRVGAKLKKARERRGLSLRQIADSTKISVPVLEGLERDDITYLPGGVLGRGFVRSFAAAVSLDPEVVVAEFVAQFPDSSVNEGYASGTQADDVKLPDIKPAKITIDHRSSRGLRIAAICALTAIFVGFLTFSAPRRLPQWVSAIQSVAETAPARIADASIRARNPEPPPAPLKPSPEPATPIAVPAPPPKVAATEGSAAARDTNRPAAAAAVVKPALPAPKPADVPPAPGDSPRTVPVEVLSGVTTRPAAEEPLKIVLSVTSPSWVIATADGKGTVSRLLDVGDEEVVDAKKEVVLTAGDGAALVMTINGAPARSLGEARETIKVRITRANFKDFLAP